MKKLFFFLVVTAWTIAAQGQAVTDSVNTDPMKGDTALAAEIINNYISYVNFEHLLQDSVVFVRTSVVERSHPDDTIKILRWYGSKRQIRIEMWQNGRMQDAFYTNGKKIFRRFSNTYRSWRNMSPDSFLDHTQALDIRGALYGWRSKGSEAYYVGEYTYNNHQAYRVFVTTPGAFDRNYFFEKETGLLFIVTEEDHIYGDAQKSADAQKVDWRGWHEFIPFRGCLMPTMESYQVNDQLFIIRNSYEMVEYKSTYFTKEVY